ncbi:hypothetical protein DSECCO2_05250 [anaerobic digester metagenome]
MDLSPDNQVVFGLFNHSIRDGIITVFPVLQFKTGLICQGIYKPWLSAGKIPDSVQSLGGKDLSVLYDIFKAQSPDFFL